MIRRLWIIVLLWLLTACGGLPMPSGVHNAGKVGGEAEPIRVTIVAPGPQPGATAAQMLSGFLYAMSVSPEDNYAVARQYLARDVECCGSSQAIIYDLETRRITADESLLARVGYKTVGRIQADGSYKAEETTIAEAFRFAPVDGELRITHLPPGLRLAAEHLDRSFTPHDVHFLGRSSGGDITSNLVPDRVFLPATTADLSQALVDALLRGPSNRLQGAVVSAAPAGTEARVRSEAGVVTVDLSGHVRSLGEQARQRLYAQLVWTLPASFDVRLLVEGEPFLVNRTSAVRSRDDWDEFDPAGVADEAPLSYIADGRLRSLTSSIGASPATDGTLQVEEAALSPSGSQLAVRTRSGVVDEVRIGPLTGPDSGPVLRAPRLSSLTWGSGDSGLWLLEPGNRSRVWLVPRADNEDRTPREVPYATPSGAGPLEVLRVSRDEARAAMVFGGRLHVGVVEVAEQGIRIRDVAPVGGELADVSSIAWRSGTELVALGRLGNDEAAVLATVAVDGSAFESVPRQAGGVVQAVAAAPRRPMVVATEIAGESELLSDDLTRFAALGRSGRAPFYPG